jgi:anti-sigma regulatory factor (Ser/Thr protein kinase)
VRELALHLLDIAENSVAAGARNITIDVMEDTRTDRLCMSVTDDGKGMDAETAARVVDPFVTSRTTRKVGLGIPLLKAAAEACNGSLTLQSELGKGTRLDVSFQRSHIDRMPLGDLPGTIQSLVVAFPEIHWLFRYQVNDDVFVFDDTDLKRELEGIPLTEPDVLAYIRTSLENGVENVQPDTAFTA